MATSLKVIHTETSVGVDAGMIITEAVVTVPARNAAEALDRALNAMERHTHLTGQGFSIESYGTAVAVEDGHFEIHVY